MSTETTKTSSAGNGGGQSEAREPEGSRRRRMNQRPPATILEWSARVVSLLVILGLVVYVTWTAFQPEVPTRFEYQVRNDEIERRGGSWVVPAKITNGGSEALEGVDIALQLVSGGEVVEEGSVLAALLGSEESVEVEFWFHEDPRAHELRFDVRGYLLP